VLNAYADSLEELVKVHGAILIRDCIQVRWVSSNERRGLEQTLFESNELNRSRYSCWLARTSPKSFRPDRQTITTSETTTQALTGPNKPWKNSSNLRDLLPSSSMLRNTRPSPVVAQVSQAGNQRNLIKLDNRTDDACSTASNSLHARVWLRVDFSAHQASAYLLAQLLDWSCLHTQRQRAHAEPTNRTAP
jgi:hypothetical protein